MTYARRLRNGLGGSAAASGDGDDAVRIAVQFEDGGVQLAAC